MKITKDDKINALERIVKTLFGCQNGKNIEYIKESNDCIKVIVECDVDDATRLLSSLMIGDIDYWFYTGERKVSKRLPWNKHYYEGYTEITLMLESRYWEEVQKLKKEIKELKGKK